MLNPARLLLYLSTAMMRRVKRVKKSAAGITLIANNPAYDPVFYSNEDIEKLPVAILGRVVELRAKI